MYPITNLQLTIKTPQTSEPSSDAIQTGIKLMREVRADLIQQGYPLFASGLITPKFTNDGYVSEPPPKRKSGLKRTLSWKDNISEDSLCEYRTISPVISNEDT